MSDQFKEHERVIVDTNVRTVWRDGTASVYEFVLDTPGVDCWRYPLEGHVVEELAEKARHAYFDGEWGDDTEIEQELWRNVVRAIFAHLLDGEPIQ